MRWLITSALSDTRSEEIVFALDHAFGEHWWNKKYFAVISKCEECNDNEHSDLGEICVILILNFFSSISIFSLGSAMAVSVQCPTKRYIVILFQPVTLTCQFQTTATQPPVVTWKYKSYCRDPVQAALNPSSADNILAQNNPNYNPNIECSDSQRTVRIVASMQSGSVSLSKDYQGRKISIINSELSRKTH